MTSHPLVAFYAARLDDEEAAARDLARGCPGPWSADHSCVRDAAGDIVVYDEYHWSALPHIARHDPQAVLAGVLADRHILARWTALQSPVTLMDRVTFPALANVVLACIADRAARFRDHPGYDPAWAPED